MISRLLGFDLAARRDPALARGAAWGIAAAVADFAPYVILTIVLQVVLDETGTLASPLLVAGALVLAFLAAWFARAQAMLESFAGTYGLVADMRLTAADRLGRMSLGRIMRHRGATLADLFTDRFSLYQDIVTHMWWQVAATAGFPVLLWLLLAWIDWRLGLLVALFVPLAALIVPWSFRLLDRAADRVVPARDDLTNRVVEIIEGAKDIRIADPAGSRLAGTVESILDLERKTLQTELAPAPAILAFGIVWSIAMAASIVLGALLWQAGSISPFALVAGLLLTVRLVAAMSDLGIFLVEYRFARRILETIRAFADEPLQTSGDTAAVAAQDIAFDNVTFAYAGAPTLDRIDLTIPAGRMTAIVGPSGAGKSTLAALVARLWDVDAGAIRIGGVDLRDLALETLNDTVSMVLQDVSLFDLSVADNIRLGRPDASDGEVEATARSARIHDRIMALPDGYATILADGVHLSGGERQRLAIARALLKNAPILILDEATASVDLDNERLIQEALENLTVGRTVVVIAHRLWTVRDADQIVVIDRGRIAQAGTHDELLDTSDLYRRLWLSQRDAQGWTVKRRDSTGLEGGFRPVAAKSPARNASGCLSCGSEADR